LTWGGDIAGDKRGSRFALASGPARATHTTRGAHPTVKALSAFGWATGSANAHKIRSTYVVTLMTRALQGSIVARMSTSSYECQVLVVGAGPTGLVLAAQLLARRDRHPDHRHKRWLGPGGLSASVLDAGSRQNLATRLGL
jgi:NADPH-dependent 2,4-dienoyl-CoA reductase/sulfur reductase-like enzyme